MSILVLSVLTFWQHILSNMTRHLVSTLCAFEYQRPRRKRSTVLLRVYVYAVPETGTPQSHLVPIPATSMPGLLVLSTHFAQLRGGYALPGAVAAARSPTTFAANMDSAFSCADHLARHTLLYAFCHGTRSRVAPLCIRYRYARTTAACAHGAAATRAHAVL